MSSFLQDVRIAVRGYLAKPLFTIVVLTILGLAIGANAAIFTVVNAVLLRPLDYPRASALVSISQRDRTTGARTLHFAAELLRLEGAGTLVCRHRGVLEPEREPVERRRRSREGPRDHQLVRSVRGPRRRSDHRPASHGGRRRARSATGGDSRPRIVASAASAATPASIGRETRLDGTPTTDCRRDAGGIRFPCRRHGTVGASAAVAHAATQSRDSSWRNTVSIEFSTWSRG